MPAPFDPPTVEMSAAEFDAEQQLYAGFTQSVRRLMSATLRTNADADEIRQAQQVIDDISQALERDAIPGAFGVSLTNDGKLRGYGNAVTGLRNPLAVPLKIEWGQDTHVRARFHLNGLYEGPPHTVHGGVIALVLDQLMGEAAAAGGHPGMTGTLKIRYEANTPLGDCSGEAWTDRVEGVKSFVVGEIRNAAGERTVSAEGIFILPRWARESIAEGGRSPSRFE